VSILAAIRESFSKGHDPQKSCTACAHFCRDPVRIEQDLKGLATFMSAHASVRAQDGLCLLHGLVINGRRRCRSFATYD
jgi:hypothetical protein